MLKDNQRDTRKHRSVDSRRPANDRLNHATVSYRISRMLRNGVLILLAGVCLGTVTAYAQDATWLLTPGSSDWNTDANWTPAAAPTGTATFDASNTTAITFSSPTTTVGTLQFNALAPAYSFNLSASNTLTITGTGIVNNSSNSPTFSVTGNVLPLPAAFLQFQGASTAGNATITNSNTAATDFFDSSTAGTATIINGNLGGTFFHGASTGGQATFITNMGGFFDISQLTSAGTTAGSIEGGGSYLLGAKALTVGSNNHSTEVSGSIADGGLGLGTGGALIKVGTGTLTLSGTSSYSGGTMISAGTLQAGSTTGLVRTPPSPLTRSWTSMDSPTPWVHWRVAETSPTTVEARRH